MRNGVLTRPTLIHHAAWVPLTSRLPKLVLSGAISYTRSLRQRDSIAHPSDPEARVS